MSDTPRTEQTADYLERCAQSFFNMADAGGFERSVVAQDQARQLMQAASDIRQMERELAAVTKERDELRDVLALCRTFIATVNEDCDEDEERDRLLAAIDAVTGGAA